MEWHTKWEWENHEIFSSKRSVSGDMGNNSSAKSSVSALTESSLKESMTDFPNTCSSSKKKEFSEGELHGTCLLLESSVSSGEPFISLKLGKRTYFENSFARSNSKTSNIPTSSVSTGKKVKSSSQSTHCQVEGCNLDLSSAKEYHRKHRVCESHSKCPKVIVCGLERRFCQQCSRFHSLSEFDEKKRSCRRRLSDHNARRRKPQQETIQFNSTSLFSSFYGGRQQLSFVTNNAPLVQTSTWENSLSTTYPVADKSGVLDSSMSHLPTAAFKPSKGTRTDVLDQGFKESLSPNVDALDLRRALSLLSNDSWGMYEPDLMALQHPNSNSNSMQSDNPCIVDQGMQSVPQSIPLSSPDYWQQSMDPQNPVKTANSQFQEFQPSLLQPNE